MDATLTPPTDAEQAWIGEQLDAARRFVADYGADRPLDWLPALDHAWASWMDTEVEGKAEPNAVVNAVGVALGQALVDTLEGFAWVIAKDDEGTDLAVCGLKGAGDVLIYPANVVAKRYETQTKYFVESLYAAMVAEIDELRAAGAAPA